MGACRVPCPDQDKYRLYDPSSYQHVIVASHGQFFAVDLTNEDGRSLPLPLIQARLAYCQDLAQQQENAAWPAVGWVTSLDRDSWTAVRKEWIQCSDTLRDALETIEAGAFVLALDEEEPTSLTATCQEFWHGGPTSGGNRWFDKSMQLLVTRNGYVAYQGEHSMLDAAPVLAVIRRIVKTGYARLTKKYNEENWKIDEDTIQAGVRNIFADCWSNPEALKLVQSATESAHEKHNALSNDFELEALQFTGFGKKQVKQWGSDGPLLAQLAIQLAGYRLFGKLVGSYEAASTRTFLHGRTETTRPVSPDTLSFVQAMDNVKASQKDKLTAFRSAVSTVGEYQAKAAAGLGVDRHLFGLSCMIDETEDAPDLFADPLHQRAKTFRFSSSSVIFTPGFGPVVDDGLGVGFNVEKDSFTFIVTSRQVNDFVMPFCKQLEQSLQELGSLLYGAE